VFVYQDHEVSVRHEKQIPRRAEALLGMTSHKGSCNGAAEAVPLQLRGNMDGTNAALRTEVRGLELRLDGSHLVLSSDGGDLIAPIPLNAEESDRLRIEMAKAQLWEWNQLEDPKLRAELRYRRYLGSWLVMCLAAFSAYLGYPSFYLCLFFAALSIFLWWRAGYEEQRADRAAQAERNQFQANWNYLRDRLEERPED
jgi:hypothetical protein